MQVITAKVVNTNVSETSMNSSDNSTDSSDGSPTAHLEGPNLDAERVLPSVVSVSIMFQDCAPSLLFFFCLFVGEGGRGLKVFIILLYVNVIVFVYSCVADCWRREEYEFSPYSV